MTNCSLCTTEVMVLFGFGNVLYCTPCMERMMRWLAQAAHGRITAEGSLVIGAGAEEPTKEPNASVSVERPVHERGADVLCIECQTPGMPRTLCNACRHKLVDELSEARERWESWKMETDLLACAAADHLKELRPLSQECPCVLCVAARAEMDRRVRAVTAPPESTLTIQTGECGTCGGWKWGHYVDEGKRFEPCPAQERYEPGHYGNAKWHGPQKKPRDINCAPCPLCNKQESRD